MSIMLKVFHLSCFCAHNNFNVGAQIPIRTRHIPCACLAGRQSRTVHGANGSGIGNTIENFGNKIKSGTPSNLGRSMRRYGKENMSEAIRTVMPQRNMYRNRYRTRM